jgi:predicted amino acid dehydrogenase
MKVFLALFQILRDLFLRFFPFSVHYDYRFAFLVHSRDINDVYRKFPFAKKLPKNVVEWWCKYSWPIVVSKITGLKSLKDGKEVPGYIIGIPMTARQMLENRKLALRRIIQACKLAEKLGVKIIGLGAFTSSLSNGGLDLIGKIKPKITTGNALAVAVSFEHIREILEQNAFIQRVAIVGGTGSIGQAISKFLVKEFPEKEYLIFARTKEHLDNLLRELRMISDSRKLKGYLNSIENLKEAELVIVATAATKAIIKSRHLKQNAIAYDVTQPQNIDRQTIEKRPDLLIYDGGLVDVPNLEGKPPFNLPSKRIYACLGETILLALEYYQENFSLGKTKIEKVLYIKQIAGKYNFKPARL